MPLLRAAAGSCGCTAAQDGYGLELQQAMGEPVGMQGGLMMEGGVLGSRCSARLGEGTGKPVGAWTNVSGGAAGAGARDTCGGVA
jgi:hypothetical protein